MQARRIDALVMHTTGGSRKGDIYTLTGQDRTNRVSIHYYITKSADIFQIIKDKDIAWHAGTSMLGSEPDVNRFSIGVELENLNRNNDPYTIEQYEAAVWLVRSKVQQYHIRPDRLVSHAQIALPPGRKIDPYNFDMPQFRLRVYADVSQPTTYYVATDRQTVQTGPSLKSSPVMWSGQVVTLPKGMAVRIEKFVPGDYVTGVAGTSNQWGHWVEIQNGIRYENGFIPKKELLNIYPQ